MKLSSGVLLFRFNPNLEVFLIHPGGPRYKNKDEGHWSIPKGKVEINEELFDAACREFSEETGIKIDHSKPIYFLRDIITKGKKRIIIWGIEGDHEGPIKSIMIKDEKLGTFPECDKGEWFPPEEAIIKLQPVQVPFVERLKRALGKRRV